MSAKYIVHKANPYFKNGLILELFTDGFMEAVLDSTGKLIGNRGLMLPEIKVKPFVMRMLTKGLDKPGLRTRKTEYGR